MISASSTRSERLSYYHTEPTLRASVLDAMYFAIMLGVGEAFLSAYGIFLKGSSLQIGLLASLPPLFGAICQLLGVQLMDRAESRRKLIVLSAVSQGLIWLPVAFIPSVLGITPHSATLLIILALLYHGFGNIGGPIWNSLIGDLVPSSVRGDFFGFRNKRAGAATFIALIIAGSFMHIARTNGFEGVGFSCLFLIASAARLKSAHYLSKHADPQHQVEEDEKFSLVDFVSKMTKSNFARFTLLYGLMNAAVSISGPYIAIYLLNDLNISYQFYTILIGINLATQFLSMHYWGSMADKFGGKRIISLCAYGVCVYPLLLFISSNPIWILFAQAFSGIFWAGFALSGATFLFDAVSPPKRARCVAYQAVVNSILVLLGALIGSALASKSADFIPVHSGLWTIESVYIKVFLVSAIFRAVAAFMLSSMFKEVREVEMIKNKDLIFRIANIRPISGLRIGILFGKKGE